MSRRPSLRSDPLRRQLVRNRLRALVAGDDACEAYVATWLIAMGVLYVLPHDVSNTVTSLRYVHEYLGGDALLAVTHLPIGVVLFGCLLRPLIVSPSVHRAALLCACSVFLFFGVLGFAGYSYSFLGISYMLLAILCVSLYARLDRQ